MLKQFILLVEYETGSTTMLTNKVDLVDAVNEFKPDLYKMYGDDKSNMIPHIISAKLLPIMYKSIYDNEV